jgi:hypothetical protein
MTQDVQLQIDNGNTKTVVVEDETDSRTFWSNYFTQSYVSQKDYFYFQSSLDLMGRPIQLQNNTNQSHIRRLFSRKKRR